MANYADLAHFNYTVETLKANVNADYSRLPIFSSPEKVKKVSF